MEKKKILLTTFIILGIIAIPYIAYGSVLESVRNGLNQVAGNVGFSTNASGGGDIAIIVGRIIKVILGLVGIVFMILTIYGGWLYMTAAGNEQRVEQAKSLLRDSVIGLIIIIAAYAITTFVVFAVTGATGA